MRCVGGYKYFIYDEEPYSELAIIMRNQTPFWFCIIITHSYLVIFQVPCTVASGSDILDLSPLSEAVFHATTDSAVLDSQYKDYEYRISVCKPLPDENNPCPGAGICKVKGDDHQVSEGRKFFYWKLNFSLAPNRNSLNFFCAEFPA